MSSTQLYVLTIMIRDEVYNVEQSAHFMLILGGRYVSIVAQSSKNLERISDFLSLMQTVRREDVTKQ
jgi:hypothetical protein